MHRRLPQNPGGTDAPEPCSLDAGVDRHLWDGLEVACARDGLEVLCAGTPGGVMRNFAYNLTYMHIILPPINL